MSLVPRLLPAALGTIELRLQVLPPSVETKMGAKAPPIGSGVNAVPAISRGLAGLTARVGSLSWLVSRLSERGTMLTTSTPAPAAAAALAFCGAGNFAARGV